MRNKCFSGFQAETDILSFLYHGLNVKMVKKVLFINKLNASSIIPEMLARAGYEIIEAYNTDTALRRLEAASCDLVILLENAAVETWAFCSEIRRIAASPFIIISPGASAESCVRAIGAGADFFIRKPFGPMELIARVNTLFQRAPSRQPVSLTS